MVGEDTAGRGEAVAHLGLRGSRGFPGEVNLRRDVKSKALSVVEMFGGKRNLPRQNKYAARQRVI